MKITVSYIGSEEQEAAGVPPFSPLPWDAIQPNSRRKTEVHHEREHQHQPEH